MQVVHFVIPYRDRAAHLEQFYQHIREHSEGKYTPQFWVVEQAPGQPFNRGTLLNIGALAVSTSHGNNAYIALHDVDMLPFPGVDYTRLDSAFDHLATAASQFNNRMPYADYFGGVVLTTTKYFTDAGGYPNTFWGWGGEDDALLVRVKATGLPYTHRPNMHLTSLAHEREIDSKQLSANRGQLEALRDRPFICGGIKDVLKSWQVQTVASDLPLVRWFLATPR
jgi:hypothetical protein